MRESSAEPVALLVVDELWLGVVEGRLEVGQRLPTARELAIALSVSPRSIERAYTELERRGVVAARAGSGMFVSLTQPSEQEHIRHRELTALCREAAGRAAELGFAIDDLIDALVDFRTSSRETQTEEFRP